MKNGPRALPNAEKDITVKPLFFLPQLVAAVVVPRLLHALANEVLPLNTAHSHRMALAVEDAGKTGFIEHISCAGPPVTILLAL